MQDNHYDIIDPTAVIRRNAKYGVFKPSRNYENYLEREGIISAGDQVVVKTSSMLMGTNGVTPADQVNELVTFVKHENWENIPTVLHWVVGFSLPSKEWGVPLPWHEYETPYKDKHGSGKLSELDNPFIIDSHRFGEIKKQVHWLHLLSKPTDPTPWREYRFAPYPGIDEGEQFAKLYKLLPKKMQCDVQCVYLTVPKDQMPAKW